MLEKIALYHTLPRQPFGSKDANSTNGFYRGNRAGLIIEVTSATWHGVVGITIHSIYQKLRSAIASLSMTNNVTIIGYVATQLKLAKEKSDQTSIKQIQELLSRECQLSQFTQHCWAAGQPRGCSVALVQIERGKPTEMDTEEAVIKAIIFKFHNKWYMLASDALMCNEPFVQDFKCMPLSALAVPLLAHTTTLQWTIPQLILCHKWPTSIQSSPPT